MMIRGHNTVKRPTSGTPGSAATERGFNVSINTSPMMEAYRVEIAWTEDGWRSVHHTEAKLVDVQTDGDNWEVDISYFHDQPVTFWYALVAAGPDGLVWDNNHGWNYQI